MTGKIRIPIVSLLLSLMGGLLFGQQTIEIKPYAGYNVTLGKFHDFSKNGADFGLSADYFFTPNFGFGLDVNQQMNKFKNPNFDYSSIPSPLDTNVTPYSLLREESGSWRTFTFSFGPTYRYNWKKFGADVYVKAGVSLVSSAEASDIIDFDLSQADLFRLKKQKFTTFGLTTGLRFYYHINKFFSVYINPQLVYSSGKVNYVSTEGENLASEIEDAYFLNPSTGEEFWQAGNFIESVKPVEASFKPIYLNLNAGFSINIGIKKGIEKPADNFESEESFEEDTLVEETYEEEIYEEEIVQEETVIEETIAEETVIEETVVEETIVEIDPIIVEPVEQERENQEECLTITSPSNGSSHKVNQEIKFLVKHDNPSQAKSSIVKIYKVSNDVAYWNKKENKKELKNTDNPSITQAEKQSEKNKFKPLTLKSKVIGSTLEAVIEKETLSEGAYTMIVSNDCGVKSLNFTGSSASCGQIYPEGDIECNGWENGKPVYTVSISFANVSPSTDPCIATMHTFSSPDGTISNISPSLPVDVPIIGSSPTVTYNYTPNVYGATTASFWYDGNWDDARNNTSNTEAIVELPNCVCNICDEWEIISSNRNTALSSDPNANLSITSDFKILNAENIKEVKAEIVSVRQNAANEECAACANIDNDMALFNAGNNQITGSNSWANNGEGTLSDDNGDAYANALVWNANSASGVDFNSEQTFTLNVNLPDSSDSENCTSGYTICVRYTFTNIDCQTCSYLVCYPVNL